MRLTKDTYLLDNIQKLLIVSFSFLLPISQRASTIIIVVLVAVSLINFKKEKTEFRIEFLPLIGLYIIYSLSLLYSTELQLGIIEQKASLLFFPVIFILNKNIINYYELILKWFVFGCIIALIVCELNGFYQSFSFVNFSFDSRLDQTLSFYKSLVNEKNHFFSYNFSFLHQTVYFSMYLLFAISILLYKNVFQSKKIGTISVFFLIIGVLQTLNKAAFLILIIIVIIFLYIFIKNKKVASIGVVLLGIIGILLLFLNPRFTNLKKSLFETKNEIVFKNHKDINNKNPNRQNFRIMLWSSAIDLIKENPIVGIGAGGSHIRLYEVFAVKRQWYDRKEKYHAHNQYLQIFMDLGIIGFIPFVIMFSILKSVFSKATNYSTKYITHSFILMIAINFLFESMFERYSGISFFSFFYCLFIIYNGNNSIKLNAY